MRTLQPQHQRAVDRLVERYKGNPETIAVIVGGSVAKGQEKEDSDVDAMIIVSDAEYERLARDLSLSIVVYELADNKGGYCDLKFFTKYYLRLAAERGSEPTRFAFTGAYCAYTADPEIPALIEHIPVYPVWEKKEKIYSFYSQFRLNKGYFWSQANKRNDPYLKARVATDVVLFGSRLILAHNEVLFPCQKWLMETIEGVANKPVDYMELAWALLRNPTTDSINAYSQAIETFTDWGIGNEWPALLTRFIDDSELWWWKNRPNVAEW